MSSHKNNEGLELLVIGLDGATFDVIRPMVAAGALPNLAALVDKGSCGCLESTMPLFSPPAWASFMTGMNPGQHGIFGFANYDPLSYAHFDSAWVDTTSLVGHIFFDVLNQAGYHLAVIIVPITHPARVINGYMVAGVPSMRGRLWQRDPGYLPPRGRSGRPALVSRGKRYNGVHHLGPRGGPAATQCLHINA